MKKITLFFMSLFLTIGAMAQIETIEPSTPESIHMYTLRNGNNNYMTSFTSLTNNEVNSGRFAFFATENDNAFKIYSVDRDLWISYTKAGGYSDGTNFAKLVETEEEAEAWNVTKTDDYYTIAPYNTTNVAGRYWNFYGGVHSNSPDNTTITIGLYNNKTDGGSKWFLTVARDTTTEVVDIHATLTDINGAEFTATYKGIVGITEPALKGGNCSLNNKIWNGNNFTAKVEFVFPVSNNEVATAVMINPFNSTNIFYKVENTQVKATKTLPTEATLKNYLWAIYPSFEKTGVVYTIKNIATNKYIYTTSTGSTHNEGVVIVADSATEFILEEKRFKTVNGSVYLSTNSSTVSDDQNAGTYTTAHNGTNNNIHREVKNYILTTADDITFEGEYAHFGIATLKPAFIATGTGVVFSNEVVNDTCYTANVEFILPFPISKTGENPNATLLSSWNEEKIWHAIGNEIKVQTKNVNPVDLNCMWAIYPIFNDYEMSYVIKNIVTDKYVYSAVTNNTSSLDKKGAVVLNRIPSHFEFVNDKEFRFAGKNQLYLSINSINDTDVFLGVHNSIHGGTDINTPTLTAFNVSVGEAGYATLYTPWEITMPATSTVTAHSVTVDGEWAKFSEPLTTIPAGTGVILKGEGTVTCTLSNSDTVAIEDNLLDGTSMRHVVAKENGEYYILAKQNNEVGFYKAVKGNDSNMFVNDAYKAFLFVKGASNVAAYSFRFGEGTTAIEEITEQGAEGKVIFDLTGRRVNEITKAGVYIVNGKKVLVK